MPLQSAIVVCFILLAFAFFAGVVLWADFYTRDVRRKSTEADRAAKPAEQDKPYKHAA